MTTTLDALKMQVLGPVSRPTDKMVGDEVPETYIFNLHGKWFLCASKFRTSDLCSKSALSRQASSRRRLITW